jgi:hypothetical protein
MGIPSSRSRNRDPWLNDLEADGYANTKSQWKVKRARYSIGVVIQQIMPAMFE